MFVEHLHSSSAKNELHLQVCINEGIERLFSFYSATLSISTFNAVATAQISLERENITL